MLIVDYECGEVVNMANVISITLEECRIMAVTKVNDILLGRYETEERAKEVFEALLHSDAIVSDSARFYMPER